MIRYGHIMGYGVKRGQKRGQKSDQKIGVFESCSRNLIFGVQKNVGFAVCSEQVFEKRPKSVSQKHHFFGVIFEPPLFCGSLQAKVGKK